MKIIQCEYGHYYDSEKFETCPHCQAIKNEEKLPVRFNSSITELSNNSSENSSDKFDADDQKTVPISDINEAGYGLHSEEILTDDYSQTVPLQPHPIPQPIQQPHPIPQPSQVQSKALDELMQKAREQRNTLQDDSVTVRFTGDERLQNPTVGWLIGINNDYYGICFELKSGKNFIGRNYDMDVVLESDMSVSRNRHAIIIYEPRAKVFIAQPGESRELFYLNDDVVLQNEFLKPYDILSIGNTKLMFFPLCGDKFSWEKLNK